MLIILRYISLLISAALFITLSPHAEATKRPYVSAEACVLMYEDGRCLYEKNPDSRMLIASTTKLMTAIVCIENAALEDRVTVKKHHCNIEGSSMYLEAGENYTVKDLLYGLLLASGNDAAFALAEHVSGTVREFAALMNEKANELGMDNTHFANPHGLDEKGHYSTARDMAKLMLYCMDKPVFRELNCCKSISINGKNYNNHNKLLSMLSGCQGGKTGFTAAAGRCLVSCCERDGLRFVCVTLSAPNDWQDHTALYTQAFDKYELRDLSPELVYELPVISGSKASVSIIPREKLLVFIEKNKKPEYIVNLPAFVFAPFKIGETAGKICVIIDDVIMAECELVFGQDVLWAHSC